jgi:ankyrin repeat protein
MRVLLAAGAQTHGAHGVRPALSWAADAGQLQALQLLLAGAPACRAGVDERDSHGFTALLDAAKGGHVRIVEALLAAGADVNAQTRTGTTALIFAAGGNNGPLVEALLRAQPAPDLALSTAAGYTAERTARVAGHMALALFLNTLAKG